MTVKKNNNCKKEIRCSSCENEKVCRAWSEYIKLDVHSRIKRYAHFDKRVSLKMPSIQQYVTDRNRISSHSFYPFIHFVKTSSRYGKKIGLKKRQLNYCSHLDRCVYQRYSFLLNYKYNEVVIKEGINEVAIAYRDILGKNNIDFAKDAFQTIQKCDPSFIMIGDFTDFFDNLDHIYLKARICDLINQKRLPDDYYAIYKNITKYAYWDWKNIVEISGHEITERGIRKILNDQDKIISKDIFDKNKKNICKNNTTKGIPQGSPISAVLSNIYMIEFDKKVNNYVQNHNGKYFRYSDDFMIVLPIIEMEKVNDYISFIFSCIKEVPELTLQEEKTNYYIYEKNRIREFESNAISNINYLGFIFDGKYCKIRSKSITKYYYRMYRKAKTIGKMNWISPNGKRISAKNLYEIYSKNNSKHTFIDYAEKVNKQLNLNDPETNSLLKNYKRKIKNAIKKGMK